MPTSKRYKCPECSGVFDYLHHPSIEADPVRFCPRCGWDAAAEANGELAAGLTQEITAPHIQNAVIVKAVEQTYKGMEDASRHNMYAAREAGLDADEARSLQITDLKDNLREGDVAAMPIQNEVTRTMEQAPGMGWGGGGNPAAAAEYAAAAHTGADSYAGLRASTMLRSAHAKAGGTVSEMVPLEIQARQRAPANRAQRRAAGGGGAAGAWRR